MASFQKYKTKNGTFWKFQFYSGIDPKTGKRKTTTRRGFKTKKEAQEVAIELEKKVKMGLYNNTKVTYEDVRQEWWGTYEKTVKPSTSHRVDSIFKKHITPRFGGIPIKEITRHYCQKQIDEITKGMGKSSSAKDVKIQANQVFKYAVKEEYIERNPMENVIVPKKESEFLVEEKEKRNFWNKDEMLHFLDLAKEKMKYQDYLIFYILLYTGMRKGELFALKWEDIDFSQQTIRINKTLYFKDGKEIIQTTKKYTSKRTISIDKEDAALLKSWKTKQKAWYLEDGIRTDIEYVVCRGDMRPMRLAYPNDVLKSFLINNPDIKPKITIHGLRHTHSSLLFEAGATIKEVQARLGHKDIQTTMNIYTHVTDYVSQKTAQTFHKFMKSE